MKKILVVVSLILCAGCSSLLDPKGYNEVQKTKWEAINASATTYNSKIETKLVEIDPKTGVVTVYNQNQHSPIIVKNQPNAFVQTADVVLNSTVAKIIGGGWAAGYVIGKANGDSYSSNGESSMSVSQDSGNPVSVETRHTEDGGSITDENHNGSDYTTSDSNDDNSIIDDHADNRNDFNNSTATPTVIKQPPPVVVQNEN